MIMKTSRILAALLLSTAMGAGATFAQPEETHRNPVRVNQAVQAKGPEVSVSFPGGSAADYVEAVEKASGQKRIVVLPGGEKFQMPAVDLEGVSLEGALMPLQWATTPEGDTIQVHSKDDVFIVVPQFPQFTRPSERPPQTQVFSLAEAVESGQVKAEDILTAVQTALSLDPEADASVKYHPETRLLIVRAGPDALGAVQTVLNGVMDSVRAMTTSAKNRGDARQKIAETEAALQAATQEVAEAQKYADQMDELVTQGNKGVTPADALQARERVIGAKQKQTELAAQLQLMQERQKAASQGDSDPRKR